MAALAAVFSLLALVAAAVTTSAAGGSIARNPVVGIRFRATLKDETAWRVGHCAAAGPMWIGCALTFALALGAFLTSDPAATTFALLALAALFGSLVAGSVAAIRAAEAVHEPR